MSQNLDQPDKLEETRMKLDRLRKLGDDPGFQEFIAALEGQLRAHRIQEFNNPIKSLDGAFESASRKGELAGIQLGLSMRKVLMDDLSADIENILDAERNEESAGQRDS